MDKKDKEIALLRKLVAALKEEIRFLNECEDRYVGLETLFTGWPKRFDEFI